MKDEKWFDNMMNWFYGIDIFMFGMVILSTFKNNGMGYCFERMLGMPLTILIVGLKIIEWSYKLYRF